jgi:hypothetical protein
LILFLVYLFKYEIYLIFTRCKKQESLPGGRLFEYADIRTRSTFPCGGHLLYVLNIFYRDFHLNFKNNHPWATSQIFNLIYFLNINQMIKTLVASILVFLSPGLQTPCLSQIQQPFKHALVITELYPDPDARSALPVSEFIEVKNVSGSMINLKGWKISDGTNTGTINASFELKPDSFVIVCSQAATTSFLVFGPAIGLTGFPSLNNEEDRISLYDPAGNLVHHVHYYNTWYVNDVKKEGGWTLEMIDPLNFCSGASNWKASEQSKGGTPGFTNSVNRSNPDVQSPAVLKSYIKDIHTVVVVFDEPLDSTAAVSISGYRFGNIGNKIIKAVPVGPSFEEIELTVKEAMLPETVYELIITSLTDCAGNIIGALNKVKCGMPSFPEQNDIILNELMFNPAPGGYDYIELYNRSKKIIDLKEIMIATKSSVGALINITPVNVKPRLIFPDEYLVLTENINWLQQNYFVKDRASVLTIANLPSLPDDKGYLAIVNVSGNLIDEISYSDKWHFALLNNKEGVALERIDFSVPANEKTNWTSAASIAGFGTPGYKNSQFRADLQVRGSLVIEAKLFSPDNDGYQDVAAFRYEMEEPGYMGSITIYDGAGRPVRFLVKSALLGMKGVYNWDGLDENLKKLPVGIYIVLMEVFNLKGRVKKIRNTITLARKL